MTADVGPAPIRPGQLRRGEVGADPVSEVGAAQARWRDERRDLDRRRAALARLGARLHGDIDQVGSTGLLVAPGWLPEAPVPLDRVELTWTDAVPAPAVDGTGPASSAVRPPWPSGRPFATYAAAMGALAPPRVFEDRPSYRLLAVTSGPAGVGAGVRLVFGPGTYFGMVDVSEAVAHELAAATRAPIAAPTATQSPIAALYTAPPARDHVPVAAPALADLPLRSAIGDPLGLGRRVVVPAITALTLRRTADGRARFLLHRRDAAKVAHGGGLTQVAPVGVFQAAGSDPASQHLDLDLWRCLTREYREELLGAPEHRSDGRPLDHEGWPFARALAAARRAGTVRAHWLGLGVDPLSLVADMLVAVVVDAPTFDELFAGLVATNDEGDLVTGDGTADGPSAGGPSADGPGADGPRPDGPSADDPGAHGPRPDGPTVTGLPFTAATVQRLLVDEPMQAAGAAVLDLAWRHRAALLA